MVRAVFQRDGFFYALLIFFLIGNIGLWLHTRHTRPVWGNVPPALSERGATMMATGDRQLAYRITGLMLQNIGNAGGESHALKDYNYNALRDWFFLADKMDPKSYYVPYLVAYYFGATQNPEQLNAVIDYLHEIGIRPGQNRWRMLAHAVYLARYRQGDLNKALDLANILAGLDRPDLPLWAKSMPAFVVRAKGDKEGAYTMMMGMLAEGIKDKSLSEYDIRLLRDNICNQILTPEQAAKDEVCKASR